jgi:hypothetical protein
MRGHCQKRSICQWRYGRPLFNTSRAQLRQRILDHEVLETVASQQVKRVVHAPHQHLRVVVHYDINMLWSSQRNMKDMLNDGSMSDFISIDSTDFPNHPWVA